MQMTHLGALIHIGGLRCRRFIVRKFILLLLTQFCHHYIDITLLRGFGWKGNELGALGGQAGDGGDAFPPVAFPLMRRQQLRKVIREHGLGITELVFSDARVGIGNVGEIVLCL